MGKIKTYLGYLDEYLRYGDFCSIAASLNYLIRNKSHKNNRIIQSSIGKFYCRRNTNDFQFANYRYEWSVKKFILNRISCFNVFIDAGACIGEYSILAERRGLRCFAFEPVHENYETLITNLELNQVRDKIRAFPFGLGDSNKQVHFAINPVNTGASHFIAPDEKQSSDMVEIQMFDSLLPEMNLNLSDKILFKLDVEGMEADVLKGASDFISTFPDILFVIETKHSDKGKILKLLNSLAVFETGAVDDYNIFARKISNCQT